LATATAFLQILANQDLLIAARQQLQLAKLNVEKVQKGLNASNKSLADMAQAQAQQSNTELDEATIQNQLETSQITLKQLMEMPNAQIELIKPNIIKIVDIESVIDTTSLLSKAILANPNVVLTNLQKDAAYQGIKIAKSTLYPTLSLFSSVGTNFSDARSLLTGTQQFGFDTIGFVNGTNQAVLTPAFRPTSKKYTFIRQFTDNFYQSAGLTLQIPIFSK
jgi:outer membrane protein